MLKKIDKGMLATTSVISLISYIGFFAVMLVIVVDVFMRKLTGNNINGAYEIVERMLMCGVFASFAYTQSLRGHVRVTMFISKLPFKLRLIVNGFTYFLCMGAAFCLAYAAVLQANYSTDAGTKTGVLGIPLFPFFWVEALCMAVFGIALVWETVKSFAALGNKELADEIMEDWD